MIGLNGAKEQSSALNGAAEHCPRITGGGGTVIHNIELEHISKWDNIENQEYVFRLSFCFLVFGEFF